MPVTIFKTGGQDSSCARFSGNNSSVSDGGSFDPIIRAAHWLTLFLILGIYATAFLMHRLPIAWTLTLQIHRSFGLMVWLVTVLRLVWRQISSLPDWPQTCQERCNGLLKQWNMLSIAYCFCNQFWDYCTRARRAAA